MHVCTTGKLYAYDPIIRLPSMRWREEEETFEDPLHSGEVEDGFHSAGSALL